MIFAGELYDESPAFEPLLRAAHHAQDFSWLLAVEVGVGKGSLFTPPTWMRLNSRFALAAAVRQERQVFVNPPLLVRMNMSSGSSRPQTLQIFVIIFYY